jgi:hypothetical protein
MKKDEKMSEEQKKKISNSEKGKELSEETKERIRKATLKQFEKGMPKETRIKISNANLLNYKPRSLPKKEQHHAWVGGRWVYRTIAVRDYNLDISQCQICGNKKTTVIHHINGNPYDNSKKNLCVLCYFCHNSIHDTLNRIRTRFKPKILEIYG